MAILIRGGKLLTMTERGDFVGDVLISGGRIQRVEEHIPEAEAFSACTLEAKGLTVLPGMIDLMLRPHGAAPAWMAESALAAGVTTALLHPEDGEECQLIQSGMLSDSGWVCLSPAKAEEGNLPEALAVCRAGGKRALCAVADARQCRRVLAASRATGVPVLLAGHEGLTELAEEIAETNAGVVIGVCRACTPSPWKTAAALDAAGVRVALSCAYPAAKMKLLPVCASLCLRDGMPRERALRAITANPAAMLGLTDRGRIAPGCRADLTLFDGDPLLMASSRVVTISSGVLHGTPPASNC